MSVTDYVKRISNSNQQSVIGLPGAKVPSASLWSALAVDVTGAWVVVAWKKQKNPFDVLTMIEE